MSIDATVRPSTGTELLDRVSALAPRFRERVPVTEAARNVPPESIDELVAAGVARLMVPREHGGSDARVRDLVQVTAAAAYGCPSTGWIAGLMADLPQVVGLFPAEGQQAVWSGGPDVVIAGPVMPTGRAQQVPGGYRITGRHAFASGVAAAEWAFVGGLVHADGGPPEFRFFLLNRSQYTVEDVWHTTAMRGTGSNTLVVDDVFVPHGHTLSQLEAREGTGPGATLNADPKFGLPWVGYSILTFTSTMLGAVEAAYDSARASIGTKRTPGGARVADTQHVQMQMGLASAKIATARTLLLGVADRADMGTPYTLEDRATGARNNAFASMLLVEAVDTLLELSGTGAFNEVSPVQQAWRDVHFAVSHISVNKSDVFGRYGRLALGVEETNAGGFF